MAAGDDVKDKEQDPDPDDPVERDSNHHEDDGDGCSSDRVFQSDLLLV